MTFTANRMDQLEISALEVNTHIGVYPWEQRIKQKLLLDIQISRPIQPYEDDLANTIDYHELCERVTQYLEDHTFQLIETVAEKTSELIKKICPDTQANIRVSKPGAIKNAAQVSIRISR